MKKSKLLFLLLPLIITSCGPVEPAKSGASGDEQPASSEQPDGSVVIIDDDDE